MTEFNQAIESLPNRIRALLLKETQSIAPDIQEIRLRAERPVIMSGYCCIYYMNEQGGFSKTLPKTPYILSKHELNEIFMAICEQSVHSKIHSLTEGFVTLKGGHRVGVAASCVLDDAQRIVNIKNVTSLNIRIAKNLDLQLNDQRLQDILNQDSYGLLIVGAPKSGKTTLLKCIAKYISSLEKNVSVVDCRSEIFGNTANNLPIHCDILLGYSKLKGIISAIKSLAPHTVICDEIGDEQDAFAILQGGNAGVNIVTTTHAATIQGAITRTQIARVLSTGAFTHIVLMDKDKIGEIKEIVHYGNL